MLKDPLLCDETKRDSYIKVRNETIQTAKVQGTIQFDLWSCRPWPEAACPLGQQTALTQSATKRHQRSVLIPRTHVWTKTLFSHQSRVQAIV